MAAGYCTSCRREQKWWGGRGSRLEGRECDVCGSSLVGASSRAGREIAYELNALHTVRAIQREATTSCAVDESALRIWGRSLANNAFRLWPSLRAD